MTDSKSIVWMGSSRSDLSRMPEPVKKDFGGALHAVQHGRTPHGSKPLKGKVKGAAQLSEDHKGDTYRAIYTVALENRVYVLHCFQKKSKSGRATPQAEIDLIERRLKDAYILHGQRTRKKR